ncbi:MAG: amino acid ABC transporter substrate-binding protein [Pseudomonadota bacterium]
MRTRHESRTLSLCLLAGLALLCCLAAEARAQEPPPVLVGGTVSLEGRFKDVSLPMRQAMLLWESQINQRGGLLGRPVRLILHDDQSDPGLVPGLYRKLLDQDKVDLLVAPYGSVLTLAAAQVCDPRGMVLVAAASGGGLWQQGFRNLFGVYSDADRYFIGVMDLLARQGFSNVAVIHAEDPFSQSAARGCLEWAQRLGLRVSLDEGFQRAEPELPALLEKVRQERPDGLILCSYPTDAYRVIALLRGMGYRPPVLAMAVAPAMPDFAEKAGDFAEGIMGPSHWEADERVPFPGTRRFIKAFKERTGQVPSYHPAAAYASLTLLENAVGQAQCLDQAKIRQYLLDLDSVTLLGRFKVDRQGHQVGHNPFIIQWQQGSKEIIYPPKMRTAKPQMPAPPALGR